MTNQSNKKARHIDDNLFVRCNLLINRDVINLLLISINRDVIGSRHTDECISQTNRIKAYNLLSLIELN